MSYVVRAIFERPTVVFHERPAVVPVAARWNGAACGAAAAEDRLSSAG